MMNNVGVIAAMVGMLLFFQLTNYGLCLRVLRTAGSAWSDLWWLGVMLAVPFGVLEFVWLQAWRVGQRGQLSVWTIYALVLACQLIGSALAVYMFEGEPPTGRKLVGLVIVCAGAALCLKSS